MGVGVGGCRNHRRWEGEGGWFRSCRRRGEGWEGWLGSQAEGCCRIHCRREGGWQGWKGEGCCHTRCRLHLAAGLLGSQGEGCCRNHHLRSRWEEDTEAPGAARLHPLSASRLDIVDPLGSWVVWARRQGCTASVPPVAASDLAAVPHHRLQLW